MFCHCDNLSMMATTPSKDSLVNNITLYNKLPIHFHRYLAPFIFMYYGYFVIWNSIKETLSFEVGVAIIVILFLIQLLILLSCFWSCTIRCLLTCSKVFYYFLICYNLNLYKLLFYIFACLYFSNCKYFYISFNLSKVNKPELATYAKVEPTRHNGSTELIKLQKSSNKGKEQIWFEFQKV